jgi:hypothetical protein
LSIQLPPIALFAFNRPAHTAQTLTALAACTGAARHDLIVFVDGPRGPSDRAAIDSVLDLLKQPLPFRSIEVHAAKSNQGLYRAITDGVSTVLKSREEVIVVEDDLVVMQDFLGYMVDALNRYRTQPSVGCIHAYALPIPDLPEYYFLRGGDCWGWATWRDRWALLERDPTLLIRELVRREALDDYMDTQGASSLRMLCDRAQGRNESWAILWHASLWLRDRLTMHPGQSFVRNIGIDGSGTHSGDTDRYAPSMRKHYHGLPALNVAPDAAVARKVSAFLDGAHGPIGRPLAWIRRSHARRAASRIASAS